MHTLVFSARPRRDPRLGRPGLARNSSRMASQGSARRLRRLRRFLGHTADTQLPPNDAHLLQLLEYRLRHALRQVHVAVILANVDAPDMHSLDVRLVRDGPHDITGLDPMYGPYF